MTIGKDEKVVPLVFYDKDGKRHVVGEAAIGRNVKAQSLLIETEEGDISGEIHIVAVIGAKYRHFLSVPSTEFSIELPASFNKPPCEWKNSNICVAEGCFGESCLKET